MPITSEEIEKYIRVSYGYGKLDSKYWLIGLEQRCEDASTIEMRIKSWGGRQLQDLEEYHSKIGQERPRLSRTWSRLIHFLWGLEGKPHPNRRQVKEFQRNNLGTCNGDNCLLELLPLPCPSAKRKDWPSIYKKWATKYSRLSFLRSRRLYKEKCIPTRTNMIGKLLKSSTPEIVLFYGSWDSIADISDVQMLKQWRKAKVFYGRNDKTVFVKTPHVSWRGKGCLTNKKCYDLGFKMRSVINQ